MLQFDLQPFPEIRGIPYHRNEPDTTSIFCVSMGRRFSSKVEKERLQTLSSLCDWFLLVGRRGNKFRGLPGGYERKVLLRDEGEHLCVTTLYLLLTLYMQKQS